MNKHLKKQKGAVMLEAAYVLPVILGVLLFVVEATAYSMNSFAANDILTETYSQVLDDVSAVSNAENAIVTTFAGCTSNKVVLNNSEIKRYAEDKALISFTKMGVNFTSPYSVDVKTSSINGFDVYVINFSGTANSLVIPGFLSQLLPISVDTVISIKDSCAF